MNGFLRSGDWTPFTPKLLTVLRGGYRAADLRADVLAGLTVAVVALPLAMALGIASGASPDKGLVTAVVAGLLISLLGGSRVQIGGPTGAFVVVVFNVIAAHGYDGLVLATLMAGAMLVVAGYARLGQVIKFIPQPVVTGFTAGIAVIIATSQVKDFLGLQTGALPGEFIPKWLAMLGALDSVSLAALALGAASLLGIAVLRRLAPKLPVYLVVVIAAAAAAALLNLPVDTVGSRFPDLPSGLPVPAMPEISWAKAQEVLPSAFTIAFLAGIEALLSAMVADGMTGFRHRSNQELVGQGVANIASALFGGLPATGAIARTATNIKAGGRTPVAGIAHALFLLLFMLVAMDWMAYVPMAALAAILFMVAWGMSETHRFIHIFRMGGEDRAVLVLTFVLTVLVDLTVAIGVGVTLSSLLFMARMSRAVEVSTHANDSFGGNPDGEDQRTDLPPGVEVFTIAGPVFFGMAGELVDALKRIGRMPKVLIIQMRMVPFLDATGAAALESVVDQCAAAETVVIFTATQKQPGQILARAGLGPESGRARYVKTYEEALRISREFSGSGALD